MPTRPTTSTEKHGSRAKSASRVVQFAQTMEDGIDTGSRRFVMIARTI